MTREYGESVLDQLTDEEREFVETHPISPQRLLDRRREGGQ